MTPASCFLASSTISRAACPLAHPHLSLGVNPGLDQRFDALRDRLPRLLVRSVGVRPTRPHSRSCRCSTHTLPLDKVAISLAAAITRSETSE